jgi:phosphocarrier protein
MEIENIIEVSNKYGLHARTSTRLSQAAKQFRSEVFLSRIEGGEEVDAKSILGVLTLGVGKGQRLKIRIVGEDAEAAMLTMVKLFVNNFGEE